MEEDNKDQNDAGLGMQIHYKKGPIQNAGLQPESSGLAGSCTRRLEFDR